MKLNEILNIKYPIIQGGMAHISDGSFAGKVSEAGALGVIGSGGMDKNKLRDEIRICKSITEKPFGVNLIMQNPYVEEMIQTIIDEEVSIVTTGAGNPGPYLEKLHKNNIKVLPVVSSVSMARRMERLGVDGVIVEGSEAGGHIGEMTTMTLLSQVSEEVSIPIIAAGGIGSGKQMLAAKVLGACGVQIGTLFLGTDECPIHDNYKERMVSLKSNNITTVGRVNGSPIRLIKNPVTRKYIRKEKAGGDRKELGLLTLGALNKAVQEGCWDEGFFMSGFTIDQIDKIRPVEEVLERLSKQYRLELEKIKNGN